MYLCIWHVLRAWQKRLWQIVGNNDKELFQSIFQAMHGIMKTDEKDLESVKSLICAQRSKWSASSDNKLKAAAKYFEYWEKKAGV